jgi:hypothetical protein
MKTGLKHSSLSPLEAEGRLRLAMSGGNFNINENSSGTIDFNHGSYLTQTASMFPKKGKIKVCPEGIGSVIQYEIAVVGFPKYWILFIAIVFCWLIFPPLIVYRVLNYHPQQLMENLLQSVQTAEPDGPANGSQPSRAN